MSPATASRSSRRSSAARTPLATYRTPRRPDRYSEGPLFGEFLAALGRRPKPDQQYEFDVALERVDGPGSAWAYDTVDVVKGRRGGKTLGELGVPLYRMLLGDVELPNGLVVPFQGAHTAQNLTAARRRFLGDLVEPLRAFLSPEEWSPRVHDTLAAAQTSLGIDLHPHDDGSLPDGRHLHAQRTTVVPPTYDGVRGEGYLHLGFDEVLTFKASEGANLMSAARPTMATMGGHAQIWRVSNVGTFSDDKTWLRKIRDRGRAAVDRDSGRGVAYFEHTIPDDADPRDENVWWDYYPPLASGLVRVDELRRDLEEMSLDAFAAEYLGRWPDAIASVQWLALDRETWEGAGTTDPMPDAAPAAIGVDMDPYARSSTITAAAMVPGTDGVLVEVIDHRPGSGWVEDAVVALGPSVAAIGVDDYGAGHDLLERLGDHEETRDKLVPTNGSDLMAASYAFDAALREHRLRWRASDYHQGLTSAAASAQRTSGRGWQWERRVSVSQTPLVAATLAAWALGRAPEEKTFFVY
jgi:hypothetical protein